MNEETLTFSRSGFQYSRLIILHSEQPELLFWKDIEKAGKVVFKEMLPTAQTLESWYIVQVLQTNSCMIITPSKIHDLQNESDEQFTDMKFMFSHCELTTIT